MSIYSKDESSSFLTTELQNVARVVSVACLIGIARCWEAFQCVTELVLLHNRCQTVPLNEHFRGLSGCVGLSKVWWTAHVPQRRPLGSVSHSTPDVGSPTWSRQSFKTTTLSFTNRCRIGPTQVVSQIVNLFPLIVCNVPRFIKFSEKNHGLHGVVGVWLTSRLQTNE